MRSATTPTATAAIPNESAYDPARDREDIRGLIAKALVFSFIVFVGVVTLAVLVTAFGCAGKDQCSDATTQLTELKTLVGLMLTPLVGIIGTVIGFYFADRSSGPGPRRR